MCLLPSSPVKLCRGGAGYKLYLLGKEVEWDFVTASMNQRIWLSDWSKKWKQRNQTSSGQCSIRKCDDWAAANTLRKNPFLPWIIHAKQLLINPIYIYISIKYIYIYTYIYYKYIYIYAYCIYTLYMHFIYNVSILYTHCTYIFYVHLMYTHDKYIYIHTIYIYT